MDNAQNANGQPAQELGQKPTIDPRLKLKESPDILSKVNVLLSEIHSSEVLYDKKDVEPTDMADLALIQCFYGTDLSRICAACRSLSFNLQMTARPSTWVFVEAQKSKSDCAFQWVKNYGIKYVFVKLPANSDGILLKNPLWNIGVENCSESRLCFIDSDVVVCNSDWLVHCDEAFLSGKDVISLTSHQYYEGDKKLSLKESVGYCWETKSDVSNSHCGFTLGLTRKAWKELGGLKPTLILDDIRTFSDICGAVAFASFAKWNTSFKHPRQKMLGYNLSLGYAPNVACHIWHNSPPGKYQDITTLMEVAGVSDVDELFDFNGQIPVWKTGRADIESIAFVLRKMREGSIDIGAEYAKRMRGLLGHPDEKHPLFVCTVVKDGFGLDLSDFVKFRDAIESKFTPSRENCPPTVVFVTDCKKFDFKGFELNVIPLDKKIVSKGKRKVDESIASLCAKAISSEIPSSRGGVAMYVPFNINDFSSVNFDVWIPDGVASFENGVEFVKI